jgi:hypothetical protein
MGIALYCPDIVFLIYFADFKLCVGIAFTNIIAFVFSVFEKMVEL